MGCTDLTERGWNSLCLVELLTDPSLLLSTDLSCAYFVAKTEGLSVGHHSCSTPR